jgi:hypothetical protein
VPVEKIVEKIVEVPIEKIVEKEIIKEIPVPTKPEEAFKKSPAIQAVTVKATSVDAKELATLKSRCDILLKRNAKLTMESDQKDDRIKSLYSQCNQLKRSSQDLNLSNVSSISRVSQLE